MTWFPGTQNRAKTAVKIKSCTLNFVKLQFKCPRKFRDKERKHE